MNKVKYKYSDKGLLELQLFSLLGGILLGLDEFLMDVWEDTSGSDGGVGHESSEFVIVSDSELDVSWDDSALLVVLGGVTCEFEDLGGEVFKNGSKVNWGTGSDSGGSSGGSHESGESTDWELKSGSGGFGD